MSETLSITTAVDLTTSSPGELDVLKEHAEHVEQVARLLRLGIEREIQRRVRESLVLGEWVAESSYGLAHAVKKIEDASVRTLCGRLIKPDRKATFGDQVGTCRRCATIAGP